MGPPNTDAITSHLAAATAALENVHTTHPEDAVRHLAAARSAVDAALNEAMAAATLTGSSLRAVADMAGVAPNSVAPRLARTTTLSGYSDPDGRVSAVGVHRARYDQQEGRQAPTSAQPLRFRRRDTRGKQDPSS